MNMDKKEIMRLIKTHYNFLSDEYNVSRIAVFGSVAKDTMTENSDLDILVEFRHPIGFRFVKLVEYLESLFGRKVDVITKAGLENIRVKDVIRDIERSLTYV
jgi:uncharacterized protein